MLDRNVQCGNAQSGQDIVELLFVSQRLYRLRAHRVNARRQHRCIFGSYKITATKFIKKKQTLCSPSYIEGAMLLPTASYIKHQR